MSVAGPRKFYASHVNAVRLIRSALEQLLTAEI